MQSPTSHPVACPWQPIRTRSPRTRVVISLGLLILSGFVLHTPTVAQEQAQVKTVVQEQTPAAVATPAIALDPDVKTTAPKADGMVTLSRTTVLIGSFTIFMLAVFVGFEVITKVPPTLHTPLMSGSNAISGITVVGAILTAGAATASAGAWFGATLGMVAAVLAMINVVGGFMVTHRMLMMFKKR